MPHWISSRMTPPVSRFTASSSRVGQGRPATGRRVGPRRLMRQPAPLPSWYTPGRTCPGPLAARPTDSPRVVRLLVSLRGENTQHRQPGRRQTDAPHHQEERARVATTLASRRNHHRDRRRRSGDAPARPARAEGARLAPWSSRPEVHGRTQGAEPMKLTSLFERPTDRGGCHSRPFFVPGRAEKPQEPRPPPRTPGESPRPSPHAPHGRLPHAVEWATGIRQQLELR